MSVRLDKVLSLLGFGSRKAAKALIKSGAVRLDLDPSPSPQSPVLETSELFVHGKRQGLDLWPVLMLNKPSGVVTAVKDNLHPFITALLPERYQDLAPVGRLDKDTTGLLLLTRDGRLNHRLTSPKHKVEKCYDCRYIGPPLGDAEVLAFKEGLAIDQDLTCLPATLQCLEAGLAKLVIQEGKFHQVKRMFKAVHREIIGLHRSQLGPLSLDTKLKEGEFRLLSDKEKALIYSAVSLDLPEFDA